MREPAGNLREVCSDCLEEEHKKFQEQLVHNPDLVKVGCFVKISFEVKCINRRGLNSEHMWIVVDYYNKETGEIKGRLRNIPVEATYVKYDDLIVTNVNEVEESYMGIVS